MGKSRSQFLKLAPLFHELVKFNSKFDISLLHTGLKHTSYLTQSFFNDINLPYPQEHLGIAQGTDTQEMARTMIAFETVLQEKKVNLIVIEGDSNIALACALTAKKQNIKVSQINSNATNLDNINTKNINSYLTHVLADFSYKQEQMGNPLADSIKNIKPFSKKTKFYKALKLKKQNYIVCTFQNKTLLNTHKQLSKFLNYLKEISNHFTVLCPLHPNTVNMLYFQEKLSYFNTNGVKAKTLNLIEPVSYAEMINLIENSRLVISDNKTINDECNLLKTAYISCKNPEENKFLDMFYKVARNPLNECCIPKNWDGKTGKRIIKDLLIKEKKGQF